MSRRPSDLELLAIQSAGSFDASGRLAGLHGITLACAAAEQALWIGADVPDAMAAELSAAFAQAPPAADPSQPPPALEPCRQILERDGVALPRSAGPSFLIEAGTLFSSQLRIERSNGPDAAALRRANPGNWQAVEWNELLDGRLGPWTMALDGNAVVSICHTPGPVTAHGAECGVWTHPAFRGRGYAAAVTAAWATLMRPSGRHLFYSTDAENVSSQRVARRLQLRPLGWRWRLGRAPGHDERVHPLSSLRRRG
jgi:RimJ/RimL family protein N-acetyltransferase